MDTSLCCLFSAFAYLMCFMNCNTKENTWILTHTCSDARKTISLISLVVHIRVPVCRTIPILSAYLHILTHRQTDRQSSVNELEFIAVNLTHLPTNTNTGARTHTRTRSNELRSQQKHSRPPEPPHERVCAIVPKANRAQQKYALRMAEQAS